MVTRQFAKDHNLELPAGYHSKEGSKNKQLSLYEMHQKRSTGISKEEHMEVVTDAWRQSDSAKAFVQALALRGYILATGKRPYVLVDFYGHTNSLPKLINDKSVRTKDIRAFLKKDYSPESLPSVDEAIILVSEHRKNIEVFTKDDQKKEETIVLKRKQEQRRQKLEAEQSSLRKSQHEDRLDLAKIHKAEKLKMRGAHIAESKRIKAERYKNRPTGLAAFLGRVSGVELLRGALHKYQDRKRTKAYLLARQEVKQVHKEQQGELQCRHALQALDLSRKEKALNKVEIREMKSLDEGIKKEARIAARGGENRIPSIPLDLTKSKTVTLATDMDHREKHNLERQLEGEFEQAASGRIKHKQIDLKTDFTRAAKGQDEDKERSSSEGPKPAAENKIRRYKRTRNRDQENDRGR